MTQTTKTTDDLEAVRNIVEALNGFDKSDQERILRWAREKAGLDGPAIGAVSGRTTGATASAPPIGSVATTTKDIKTFVVAKTPKTLIEFIAVVAYFNRFELPREQYKDSITAQDIMDACRLADYPRPKAPGQALVDAYHAGVLDKIGSGQYRISAVGENLVAIALPRTENESGGATHKRAKKSRRRRK